ncbi:pilus assembly protein [Promicromonospora sp. MS192]|uniref:pilus assembly protein n=1 Tax=Promicromonospora sp. MS192 TaxID=3412684 RepID=UPI003C2E14D3
MTPSQRTLHRQARPRHARSSVPMRERGSVVAEALVILPVFIATVALVGMAARLVIAQQVTETAAADAARAASIARTVTTAQTDARAAADRSLADQGLRCAQLAVDVDTSQVGTPAGQRSTVTATITCHVALGDLAAPGLLPGTVRVQAVMTSPLDRFRSTTP